MFTSIMGMVKASKRKSRTVKQRKIDEEDFSQGCGCVIFIAFRWTALIMGGVVGLWLKQKIIRGKLL